jgi:uncharacterized protein (TIGR01244 family)
MSAYYLDINAHETGDKRMRRASYVVFACFAILSLSSVSDAQKLTGSRPSANIPAPVALDLNGQFQEKFARVGDDVFISGQPTAQALRELQKQGVTTVVNLRTPAEMTKNVPFDEPALVKQLGMEYVFLPMRGNAEYPYTPEAVKAFADAMTKAKGKVLLHCTVAWRASHMWAAYLIAYRNVPVATALEQARKINLMDDMRMDGDKQPLEDLLGRAVPEIGHPKH